MEEIAFNLLREPWIRVMKPDSSVVECSLMQTLLDSHQYLRLAGELPTQDVAILRLLLAVLHTVFYRVDTDGEEAPLEEREDALDRWKSLWDAGHLPEQPIREYLVKYEDRFWLFHPENPFYQVPGASTSKGQPFKASKLNGELSESGNKDRLFSMRAGGNKNSMSYAEAARWLLTQIGFDDSGSIKRETGTGTGWLGQHVNLYAAGQNLFETLLLNLELLNDEEEPWEENKPIWERPTKKAKKEEIPVPENQAELLTLQSRRTILLRNGDRVTGYYATGGDFFGDKGTNAFSEQMIQWRLGKAARNAAAPFIPVKADASKMMWMDFAQIAISRKGSYHMPGIAKWIQTLKDEGCITNQYVYFHSVGVSYDSNVSSITDVISDHLDFHTALLTEAGEMWRELIEQKISQTERAAGALRTLADELYLAEGGSPAAGARKARAGEAAQEYYASVDIPFRTWLRSIDPAQGDDQELREEKRDAWRQTAYRLAVNQGKRMVRNAGEHAFVGRWITNQQKNGKKENQQTHHSSAEAFDQFKKELWICFQFKHQERGAADA